MKRPLRVAIPVLACLAAILVFLDWRRERHRDIEVFDVGARARAIALASPDEANLSNTYYVSPGGTVHLHVLGKSVTCDLHIHEHTEEATVPAMGRPVVTQRFGTASGIETRRAEHAEGTLIVSPPYCAHEWVNPSSAGSQANLVFTFGAPFPGNLFVAPDDPRIRGGGAPVVLDPDAALAAFVAGGDRLRRVEVPLTHGSLAAVLIKDELALAPEAGATTLLLAVRGHGRIEGGPERIDLAPEVLVVLRRAPAMRVVATASDPLVAYVARMPHERR